MKILLNILIVTLISFTSGIRPVPRSDSDISLKIKKDTVEYFNDDKCAEITLVLGKNSESKKHFIYNKEVTTWYYFTLREFIEKYKSASVCRFEYLLTDESDHIIHPNSPHGTSYYPCKEKNMRTRDNPMGYTCFALANSNSEDFVLTLNLHNFYYLEKGCYKVHLAYYASSEYPHPWLQQYLKYKDIKWEEVCTSKETDIGSFILHVKG